jgi:hypothetical protein
MATSAATTAGSQRVRAGRLWWVGLLAIVASALANSIVRAIAVPLLGISPEFMPLQISPPIFFSVIGVLGAVIVFAIVARFSSRPIQLFRRIALAALALSIIPDIGLLFGDSMPGTSPAGVIVLILMHLIAWAISVRLLTAMTVE